MQQHISRDLLFLSVNTVFTTRKHEPLTETIFFCYFIFSFLIIFKRNTNFFFFLLLYSAFFFIYFLFILLFLFFFLGLYGWVLCVHGHAVQDTHTRTNTNHVEPVLKKFRIITKSSSAPRVYSFILKRIWKKNLLWRKLNVSQIGIV